MWRGYVSCMFVVFFFKQKTAYEMRIRDWSSDVCSSDLSRRCKRSTKFRGFRAQHRRRLVREARPSFPLPSRRPHADLLLASSLEFRFSPASATDEPLRARRPRLLLGGAGGGDEIGRAHV